MAAHPFLSDEWIAAARAIHAELRPGVDAEAAGATADALDLRINVVVTEVPFGEGRLHGHLDAADGSLDIEVGHLDAPQATVTLDYDTARALVVDRDTQSVTRAFMGGRLSVDGDLAGLLAVVARPASPTGTDLADRIRAITL